MILKIYKNVPLNCRIAFNSRVLFLFILKTRTLDATIAGLSALVSIRALRTILTRALAWTWTYFRIKKRCKNIFFSQIYYNHTKIIISGNIRTVTWSNKKATQKHWLYMVIETKAFIMKLSKWSSNLLGFFFVFAE